MDRLLVAVRIEDRELAITNRLEQLVAATKQEAQLKATIYARKSLIKAARASALPMARETAEPVPLMETFFQFQLMTAARRSETLNLTWAHVDLIACTAYLPETKNGRPRTLPLRSSLVELLRRLPRTSERVFPISTDFLRNAWARICERAGVVDLHIHDLRHEGISQMAETGRFSVVDLQAFSGHRDVRMLLRYAHLCARQLAERLNEAFNEGKSSPPHKGRKRLRSGVLPLTEVLEAAPAVTHDDLRRKSL
jgi:integrase